MTTADLGVRPGDRRSAAPITGATRFYRSVWRWHFYAGLIAAPILLVLALTGAIYLFNDEIDDVLHHELRFASQPGPALPLSRIANAVRAAVPGGRVSRIDAPAAAGRTFEVYVDPPAGEQLRVFVDPATARVLGRYIYEHTLDGFAKTFHGSLMLGPLGDAIVELTACWGFILAATGLYLWWPRGQRAFRRAFLPDAGASGRRLWKSVHASIGAWVALLMMFLILTGLPWAGIWGGLLRGGIQQAGIGYPSRNYQSQSPQAASRTVESIAEGAASWTVNGMTAPASLTDAHHHSGHDAGPTPPSAENANAGHIGLDRVAEIIAASGMTGPYRLVLPKGATGTFSAFLYPDRPQGQRTLYIDQYSGRVLADIKFAEYGAAAKAIELGVQIHMGNYFGRINQIVMLMACLGIFALSITGPYMWWLRRPKGAFAAPQAMTPATLPTLAFIVCGLGVIFPLAGASLMIVLALDWLAGRIWDKRRVVQQAS